MLRSIELSQRAKRIRFAQTAIAKAAKRDLQTVHRAFNQRHASLDSTLSVIDDVITAEEKALAKHLCDRFGKPELYEQICPPDDQAAAA